TPARRSTPSTTRRRRDRSPAPAPAGGPPARRRPSPLRPPSRTHDRDDPRPPRRRRRPPLRPRRGAGAQLPTPAPVRPRRAPPEAQGGRRAHPRLLSHHRLPPPRHREALRAPPVLPERPPHRPHGLRGGGDQQPGLRGGGREARRARGAAAGALHPHHP